MRFVMPLRNVSVYVVALAAMACRSSSSVPHDAGQTPSVVAAAAVPERDAGGAHAAANAAATDAGDDEAQSTECLTYEVAMARGRAATKDKRYARAIRAFVLAIRRRPFDASAWAERGYAELLAGRNASDSLTIARSRTKRPALLSAIWFNSAENAARQSRDDEVRIFYAIAASYGNRVAATKLGTQSRCTAAWDFRAESLQVSKGWTGALHAMPESMCAEQRAYKDNEAAAHKEACRGCNGIGAMLDHENHCTGAEPWSVPNGFMGGRSFSVDIQPLGGNRFFVTTGDTPAPTKTSDGWSATYTEPDIEYSPRKEWPGSFEEGAECPVDDVKPELEPDVPSSPVSGEAGDEIAAGHGPETTKYYDKSGKARIEVTAWQGKPEVTFVGNTAKIRGAGCDATVPLGT